ncbi:ubiquinol-cytochrome c reductase iron-sulfur subunit [Salinibaculum rarum]|uniref:ubiquinol-cytochrome c reductase iron-sulfur subunit n=1 Tax=Salinibaculum rarum TaxID=3058903 RepID=UPI0026602B92|nr:ubiquinol-cytochrome c reductase iron-sulfur subunit [Salinibaculum sp. KK48]
MPVDEDKYPEESGRRRFIKGVVGSAALAGVTASAGASLNLATSAPGAGGGTVEFIGIEITDGPAPRGMPIIPVEISDGTLQGLFPEAEEVQQQGRTVQIAETDVGGTTYSSSWFQYCGVQQYAGTQPGADANNTFTAKPDGTYEWMSDLSSGDPLTVDNFSDYEEWGNGIGQSGLGKPAMANWRNTSDGRALPVQVIRSPEVPKMANGEGKYSELPGAVQDFLAEATDQGFMAWLDKCTHFCCVPGFKTSEYPGAEDGVYCQCHQSIYDPFSPTQYQFVALPRPD